MDGHQGGKQYEAFKIPARPRAGGGGAAQASPEVKKADSSGDGCYYEIEYGAGPIPGVGRFVLKGQKIEPPEKDEIKELFHRMRDIARDNRSLFSANARFFDLKTRLENAGIFYKQALFMKDFTDSYAQATPYSAYFPYYQMMGYEQLRTYFTWRTEVRKGNVAVTSLSYAFLYMYELLSNIGVSDPQDGLNKLLLFWKAFRVYDATLDKYVPRWLKEYHIYYALDQGFKAFIEQNGLEAHYPKIMEADDGFFLFSSVSKYDIRKSAFFTGERTKLCTDCFYFVHGRLERVFAENGVNLDEAVFYPAKKMTAWTPFKDALFYPWMKQEDRLTVLSETEVYLCKNNRWTFSAAPASESGRQLMGYIMKQTEAVLRKATGYKFKLTANLGAVTHAAVEKLDKAGLSLEKIISDAVYAFYREATKTVVQVDHGALLKIRREALETQEKLVVPEPEAFFPPVPPPPVLQEKPPVLDAWAALKGALSQTELGALRAALQGAEEAKKFADACGVMAEVLFEGVNEKAVDLIGDSLTDEELAVYDDYKDQIKEWVEGVW